MAIVATLCNQRQWFVRVHEHVTVKHQILPRKQTPIQHPTTYYPLTTAPSTHENDSATWEQNNSHRRDELPVDDHVAPKRHLRGVHLNGHEEELYLLHRAGVDRGQLHVQQGGLHPAGDVDGRVVRAVAEDVQQHQAVTRIHQQPHFLEREAEPVVGDLGHKTVHLTTRIW